MTQITTTKQVTRSGDALVLNVTKEIKSLGLGYGDHVEIIIRNSEVNNASERI